MTSPIQRVPYLRNQRNFPSEIQPLVVELNRSYTDIANAVNNRTIGIFPTEDPVATGENWYLKGQRQQTLREVYQFTAGTLTIPHGINVSQISGVTRIYGTFVDSGGIWYPLPFVSSAAAANQVQVVVNGTDIVITAGGGAPAISSGFVVLEWLSQV